MKLHPHSTASAGARSGPALPPRFCFLLSQFLLFLILPAPPAYSTTYDTLYNIQFLPGYATSYQSGPALSSASGTAWNRLTGLGTYSLNNSLGQSSSVSLYVTGNGTTGGSSNPSFGSGCAPLMPPSPPDTTSLPARSLLKCFRAQAAKVS